MWGGRENPLVILDLCDSFLLLHMTHSPSHKEKFQEKPVGSGYDFNTVVC